MTETTIWDIDEHRGEPPAIRRLALQESMSYLASYLDGDNILEPRTVAPEHGGNPIIMRSVEGIYVSVGLDPGRLRADPDSPLVGRGIQRIWDEDGHLFLTGARFGETRIVEVRHLTDMGVKRLVALADATYVPPHWVSPVNRSYDSSDAMWDGVLALWRDPAMAAAPDYAARSEYLPKARAGLRRATETTDHSAIARLLGADPADPTSLSMGGADIGAPTL